MDLREPNPASRPHRRATKSHKRLVHAFRRASRRPSLLSSRGCSEHAAQGPPPPPPPAVPPVCPMARIDKYVLLEAPSEDRTLPAVDRHTGEEMVCKVLELQTWQASLQPYFQLPAHAHVARPCAVLLGETLAYALFARAAGGDAPSYVRSRGRLGEEEAARLFRQMAEAVAHCHGGGLALGGLSLRRFAFADAERTHVILTGLEGARSPPSDGRSALGPGVDSDQTADVWGLGVSLYAMLLGRYPFQEADETCRGRHDVSAAEGLSPEACCLLRALLCRESAARRRITAQEALEHPWFRTDFARAESVVADGGPSGAAGGGGPKGSACDQTVPETALDRDCYYL